MHQDDVCVVGLGYIGIPTAVLLAGRGRRVYGFDIKASTVAELNAGRVPIVEPGLEEYLSKAVASGLFTAHLTPRHARVYILCVPTPSLGHNGGHSPDLSHVFSATKTLAPYLKPGDLVILESTSPVGTTDRVRALLGKLGVNTNAIHIAYCPERVLPSNALEELVRNDRIVGGLSEKATEVACAFYRSFVKGEVVGTDARTAEMSKLVENSYRDVNIAFANELSILCANEGIDVWELIGLANRHPRVNILQPGAGVGGHCIAVDPWFLIDKDPANAKLIRAARDGNVNKTKWVCDSILAAVQQFTLTHGKAPVVGCFGLAFKPNIDDLRESPALNIAKTLQAKGHITVVVEPNISRIDGLSLVSKEQALEMCDIRAVLVGHRDFKALDWAHGKAGAQTLDFCGIARGAAVRPAAGACALSQDIVPALQGQSSV